MRRAADLYAGTAKTDPRDAWVLADYARRNPDRLQWVEVSDELLVRLRVLNGHDTDLASDANRTINRCRDALFSHLTCPGTGPGTAARSTRCPRPSNQMVHTHYP